LSAFTLVIAKMLGSAAHSVWPAVVVAVPVGQAVSLVAPDAAT
jgi:hypothetical protein